MLEKWGWTSKILIQIKLIRKDSEGEGRENPRTGETIRVERDRTNLKASGKNSWKRSSRTGNVGDPQKERGVGGGVAMKIVLKESLGKRR